MIKLTGLNGTEWHSIWITPSYILTMTREESGTRIVFGLSAYDVIVKETPEQILELINPPLLNIFEAYGKD